jgi:DNA polymerase-3 subunit alpha
MDDIYGKNLTMNTRSMNTGTGYIMVFDTETTGFIPKDTKNLDLFPYITQLSFVVFDINTQKVIKCYNKYINIPEHVEITEFITGLTGVTREKCDNGVPIIGALHQFYIAYMSVKSIVAHNLAFDIKMIETEIQRNHNDILSVNLDICFLFDDSLRQIGKFCTMNMGKPVCNIVMPRRSPSGMLMPDTYVKVPKLSELYEKIFGHGFINGHDALTDTLACLRCFVSMYYGYYLDETIMETTDNEELHDRGVPTNGMKRKRVEAWGEAK